jgi:hypothetical protein
MPVDKTKMLRRRQKRKKESRRLKQQTSLLQAKKETLRNLLKEGRLPHWVAQKRNIEL